MQNGETPPVKNWNLSVLLSMYWDMGHNLPIVPQFWFIRNLMVFILFTPVVYYMIKKLNILLPLILGVLWVINIGEFDIPGTMCLFWASLGGYFSIQNISISEAVKRIKYVGGLYPLLALIDILTKGKEYNIYIHNFGILSGIIFLWSLLACFLAKKTNFSANKYLLASTFFVFAMHEPYAGKIKSIFWKVLPDLSINQTVADIQLVVYYFLWVIIWITFLVFTFLVIKRIMPKLAMFLSGGR